MSEWVTRYRIGERVQPTLPANAEEAIRWLAEGNQRFTQETESSQLDWLHPEPTIAPRQAPFGAVLACADARVPLELVYDAEPNQLFVVRVAGNVLGEECLGSIEYALASFRESLKTLIVTGHTGCGAVAAAVETYLSPKHHAGIAFSRSLRAVVNHILIATHSAALSLAQTWGVAVSADPGYRDALTAATIFLNAAMTAYQLRLELRPEDVGVQVAYGVYDLVSGRVTGPATDQKCLTPAPLTPESLVDLGLTLAHDPRVTCHLRMLRSNG